jgi:hypothetical protein
MTPPPARAVEHEQARRAARRRILRDQLDGEIEFVVGEVHGDGEPNILRYNRRVD